jgi:hypothetical protein
MGKWWLLTLTRLQPETLDTFLRSFTYSHVRGYNPRALESALMARLSAEVRNTVSCVGRARFRESIGGSGVRQCLHGMGYYPAHKRP